MDRMERWPSTLKRKLPMAADLITTRDPALGGRPL